MVRRPVALLALLALLLAPLPGLAQPAPPELTRPVNDFAGVIGAEDARTLDTLIRALQAATGDVLVVATVDTYQPYADLPSYAVKMFENGGRGIGTRKDDGGVLVVLAVNDRQVRVEVGYGLEGFITDGFAGEVSRDTMVPFFRRGDYGGGLAAGARRLAERIADGRGVQVDFGAPVAPERPARRGSPWRSLLVLLAFFLLSQLFGGGGGGGRGHRRRWSSGVGPFIGGAAWGAGWGGGGGFGGGFGGGGGGGFGGFGGGRSGGGGGGAGW